MDADRIIELLHGLGSYPARAHGKWVTAPCPFAKWTHATQRDEHPSFAVSVDVDDRSSYNCFTCRRHGKLGNLPWVLANESGRKDLLQWATFIHKHNQATPEVLAARLANLSYTPQGPKRVAGAVITPATVGLRTFQREPPPVLEESELRYFEPPPPHVLAYLQNERRLVPTTMWAFGMGWSPSAERISIPVRDIDGKLVGITGRLVDTSHCRSCRVAFEPTLVGERYRPRCPQCGHGPEPKFMHTKGFKRDYVLFGEHRARKQGPIILVEGHFDAIYLQQYGYPAVAVMGTHLSSIQIEKIRQNWTRAVVFFDDDKAGREGAEYAQSELSPFLQVRVVSAQDKDPDQLSSGALVDLLGPPDRRDALTPYSLAE